MSNELDIDGRDLLALAEDAPEQVEVIIEMLIDADEELFPEDADAA